MESACNVDTNICRVCFQAHYNTISLYSEKYGNSIFEKLVSKTKLNIAVNDGGPSVICGQCCSELNVFIEFSDKCDRANALFLQYKENNLDVCKNSSQYNEDQEKLLEDDIDQTITNDGKISDSLEEDRQVSKITENNNQPVKHMCQYCSKVFTRRFNLKLHLLRHSGEAPRPRKITHHTCPAPGCDKTFTSVTNLNTHVRRHNGERPYECTDCGKTFRSSTTLNDHKRIHTGVKPYMCPICGQRFTTNKLSAHLRTHAPRAHTCVSCSRVFASARSVREHARTHAPPAREHACVLCSARYNHKQSLNKHVRKRHGMKTSSTNLNQQTGFT